MRELDREKIFLYGGAIAVVIATVPFVTKIPRSFARYPLPHVLFILFAGLMLAFLPDFVADEIFSPGGVLVVGTIVPIYNSIVAACSIDSADDTAFLQFWIASACFSFATEFMDEIKGTTN